MCDRPEAFSACQVHRSRIDWQGDDLHSRVRNSDTTYGFRQSDIDRDSWGRWTYRFTCNR